MTRIGRRFEALKSEGQKGFVSYITAGDPDMKTTHQLVLELDRQGVDVLELGIPFSDPLADGPVIQEALDPLSIWVEEGEQLHVVRKESVNIQLLMVGRH